MCKWVGLMIVLVVGIFSCADEPATYPETAQWTVNPNGDSELALLMRAMYDDGVRVKHQIINGRKADSDVDLSRMYTADATEPEKVASPQYAALGAAYENAVDALQRAKKDDADEHYQAMVNACMACHQAMCPGPKERIKKMFFSKKQMAELPH